MGQIINILRTIICIPIRLYQSLIRPVLLPCCRFYPSCSDYALTAIKTQGIVKGLSLTIRRLLRCHPWADGGYDPVIPTNKENF